MGQSTRGQVPAIEWEAVTRAGEAELRGPVPAMSYPVESANVIRNKEILLLNRAGSHPGNPILAGLGMRDGFEVGQRDRLTGLFIFQDRRSPGVNLKGQAGSGGPGIYLFDFMVGSGQSVAGSPLSGAIRNYVRWQTNFGADEKQFFAKTKDADIVAVNGMPALDPSTLDPVERTVNEIGGGRPWIDVPIDFFVSWGDEFQQMHRLVTTGTPENGFQKAYGGAAFVGFRDTGELEGVGVMCSAVTDAAIGSQHVLQVQNTPGLKLITVRFRSRAASVYFVDVPILIRVLTAVDLTCLPPVDEACGEYFVKFGQTIKTGMPSVPSVPGVQAVAGTVGPPVDRDLLILAIHAASVGTPQKLLVRKYRTIEDSQALVGFTYQQIGGALIFLPVRTPEATPAPGAPYGAAEELKIAMDVAADRAIGVSLYLVSAFDGTMYSPSQPFPGPGGRDSSFLPAGGDGGGDPCTYE